MSIKTAILAVAIVVLSPTAAGSTICYPPNYPPTLPDDGLLQAQKVAHTSCEKCINCCNGVPEEKEVS